MFVRISLNSSLILYYFANYEKQYFTIIQNLFVNEFYFVYNKYNNISIHIQLEVQKWVKN